MQDIFCLACNPSENYFINSKIKKIYFCEDFAKAIWLQENINNATEAYDRCGFKVTETFTNLTAKNYIIPSQVINKQYNFLDFYKFFALH